MNQDELLTEMITYKLTVEQYIMRLYKIFLVSFPTLLVSTLTILKLLLEHILSRMCLTLDPVSYAQLIFVGEVRQEIL